MVGEGQIRLALGDECGFGSRVLVDEGLGGGGGLVVCVGCLAVERCSERGKGRRGEYLCLSYFGVGGDVAVVLFGDLGFSLAEVFVRHVEGGFGHGCCGGMFD